MAARAVFSHADALRIATTVRRVEKMPRDMAGGANRADPQDQSFWAYLSSPGGAAGFHWSWVRVVIVEEPPSAGSGIIVTDSLPLWDFARPIVSGYESAREANGNREVPPGIVVKLELCSYDSEGGPLYVFQHAGTRDPAEIPPHDHRDNFHGGFAFSCFHPGTALPQQPFRV